jgi:hypothetical protein
MGVVNRRNAVLGWTVWTVGKRVAKRKAKGAAKGAVPTIDSETKKPNKSAVALLIAAAVGVASFVRKRTGGEDEETSSEE